MHRPLTTHIDSAQSFQRHVQLVHLQGELPNDGPTTHLSSYCTCTSLWTVNTAQEPLQDSAKPQGRSALIQRSHSAARS